jgi:type I restriction enzyme, S subunit
VNLKFDLPPTWCSAPIGEIAQMNPRGFCLLANAESLPVHFVPMSAVNEEFGGISITTSRRLAEVQKGYTSFLEGDVIFAKITPCMENGKMALVPSLPNQLAFGSTEFHVLRAQDKIQPKWIAYFLSQAVFRRLARQNMTGSAGQLRVPTNWLAATQLPIPPANEQPRIIAKLDELLTDLDVGVAELKTAQKKLGQYRQSLLKAAGEGALTADWRSRNHPTETGAQLLERILAERRARWEAKQLAKFNGQGKVPPKDWQSKYPEPVAPSPKDPMALPEGWILSCIGQCFNIAVGATPSRKQPAFWDGSIPWASSSEVQFCYITKTKETITEAGLNNSSTQINPIGSVLLGMIGEGKTRGQVAILNIEAANNQNCAAIWVAETGIEPEYVYYWLWSQYDQTRRGSSGNNQPALNKSIIGSISFPLPPLPEMRVIVGIVNAALLQIDAQSKAIELSLKQAAAQRKNILKAAFSGQLVPQDPSDEPASVLLARIRDARAERATQAKVKKPRASKAL